MSSKEISQFFNAESQDHRTDIGFLFYILGENRFSITSGPGEGRYQWTDEGLCKIETIIGRKGRTNETSTKTTLSANDLLIAIFSNRVSTASLEKPLLEKITEQGFNIKDGIGRGNYRLSTVSDLTTHLMIVSPTIISGQIAGTTQTITQLTATDFLTALQTKKISIGNEDTIVYNQALSVQRRIENGREP